MSKDCEFDLQQIKAKSSVELLQKYKIKVENDKASKIRKESISNQGKNQQPIAASQKQSVYQEKYIVPDKGKKVVYAIINDAWRRYKCTLKKKYFLPYKTLRERLKHRPDDIPEEHFKALMEYFALEVVQEISLQNKKNIAQQNCRHRAGPISFARIRERMTKDVGEPPSQAELFIKTRQSNKGKELDHETNDTIIKLQDLVNSGQSSSEAFQNVVGKEKPGRVRCYGRTTTATMLKRNEEIAQIKKVHATELKELKEQNQKFQQGMEQKFQILLKTMLNQNSSNLNMEALAALFSTPPDVNSALRSSTSTHAPGEQVNNECLDDEDQLVDNLDAEDEDMS